MLFFLAFAAELVLAYGIKAYWHILIDTQVGRMYIAGHRQVHWAMMTLFSQKLLVFCLEVAVMVLVISLLAAAAAEFSLVARFLYHSMSPLAGTLVWGAAIMGAASWRLMETHYWINLEVGVLLTALPALILCQRCFDLSHLVVPEFPVLLGRIRDAASLVARVLARGLALLMGDEPAAGRARASREPD